MESTDINRLAQILYGVCVLAGIEFVVPARGILDEALFNSVHADKAFGPIEDEFRWVSESVGMRCYPLEEVASAMVSLMLGNFEAPSYQVLRLSQSRQIARHLLKKHGVTADDATAWGKSLKQRHHEALEAHQAPC